MGRDSYLISVVVPTHNAESHVGRCLDSLCCQTFREFDVCVVDALSTDGTCDVVERYRSTSGMALSLWSGPDAGVYDAMNKGIALAKGDWLYFLGADDALYDPEVLAHVSKEMAAGDADLLYGDVVKRSHELREGGEYSLERLLFKGNICHQAIFYHRSVFDRIGTYSMRYPIWADWELNIRCFRHPGIRTRWLDRLIATCNDVTGLSREEDPVFRMELPATLLRDAHCRIHEMANSRSYRWGRRLFGWLD